MLWVPILNNVSFLLTQWVILSLLKPSKILIELLDYNFNSHLQMLFKGTKVLTGTREKPMWGQNRLQFMKNYV